MKRPASGTLLVFGFALFAAGAIALNLYVNRGEGSLRPDNDPRRRKTATPSASPARTVPSGAAAASTGTAVSVADATPTPFPDEVVIAGVVMADGSPFEGARVGATSLAANATDAPPTTSGRDGRFELAGPPPAPFRLRADAPGWRPGVAEIASIGDGGRVDGVVLTLGAAGSVRGRVTASDGKPVANARMFVGDERGSDVNTSLEAQARTAPDGEFELTPVRPGRMTVAAFLPGEGFAAAVVEVREGEAATADLSLAPLGQVRGRVLASDGEPIAEVQVVAIDSGDLDLVPQLPGASRRLLTVTSRLQPTMTDANGEFEFRTLASRAVSFSFRKDGWKPGSRKLDAVELAKPAELTIRLEPTADSR